METLFPSDGMKALARQSVRVIFIEFIELERFGDIH